MAEWDEELPRWQPITEEEYRRDLEEMFWKGGFWGAGLTFLFLGGICAYVWLTLI